MTFLLRGTRVGPAPVDVIESSRRRPVRRHRCAVALFIEERVPPGLTAERTVELIHRQGGLAVAPHLLHPISYARRGQRPLAELLDVLPVDAVEVHVRRFNSEVAQYVQWDDHE